MFFPALYIIAFILGEYGVDLLPHLSYFTYNANMISNKSFPNCGKQPVIRVKRISGGRTADIAEAPWMVSFQMFGSHLCGGAIISDQWILTAAHCLENISVSSLIYTAAVTGQTNQRSYDYNFIPRAYQIENLITHENYSNSPFVVPNYPEARRLKYDIGLIKLKYKLLFSKYVQPVCLLPDYTFYTEVKTLLFGWGQTRTDDYSIKKILHALEFPILTHKECNSIGKPLNLELHENEFCAGYTDRRGNDSCMGDSGSPLMLHLNGRWFAVGLVSWGSQECENSQYPTVFVKISSYNDWISGKMKLYNL